MKAYGQKLENKIWDWKEISKNWPFNDAFSFYLKCKNNKIPTSRQKSNRVTLKISLTYYNLKIGEEDVDDENYMSLNNKL